MHTKRKRFMSGSDRTIRQVRGIENEGMVSTRMVREVASN